MRREALVEIVICLQTRPESIMYPIEQWPSLS